MFGLPRWISLGVPLLGAALIVWQVWTRGVEHGRLKDAERSNGVMQRHLDQDERDREASAALAARQLAAVNDAAMRRQNETLKDLSAAESRGRALADSLHRARGQIDRLQAAAASPDAPGTDGATGVTGGDDGAGGDLGRAGRILRAETRVLVTCARDAARLAQCQAYGEELRQICSGELPPPT